MHEEFIHQEILQHLDAAVAEVFILMLGRSCTPHFTRFDPCIGFAAYVQFSGSMRGACVVQMGLQAANVLTENLLGETPGCLALDSSLSADTVGEICNMIAGTWKSHLAPALATCVLSSPIVTFNAQRTDRSQPHPTLLCSLTRAYRFEDHCLGLELTID